MATRIPALLFGSALLFHVSAAAASTIDWSSPESRDLKISWSSQTAEQLQDRLAVSGPEIADDGTRDDRVGPTGGVLLHSYNGIHIELQPASGLVRAVRVDENGDVVIRRLFDAFAAGSSVFNPSQDAQVLVTFSVGRSASGRGLLEAGGSGTRVHFQFDVVIYEGSAGGAVLDQVSLSFDATNLKPTLRSKDAKSYTDPASSYEPYTMNYWNPAADEHANLGRGRGRPTPAATDLSPLFETPTHYWNAASDDQIWDPNTYWSPVPMQSEEPADAEPTVGGSAPATPTAPQTPSVPAGADL